MGLFKKKSMRPSFMDPEHDYANATFFGDVFERLDRRTFRKEKIYIELFGYWETVDGQTVQKCHRTDRWTMNKASELRTRGFTKVVNFPGYDSLAWWGVPIYIRLINFHQFDVHAKDEYGRYLYPQDTSGTLHDEMISNATHDFMKGLFKTTLPTLDLQKIGMIAILGVGAFFGLMMMGVI